MAEATSDAPRSGTLSLGGLISIATGFVAVVGAILYAIMRYSYQQFYNVFGLTPDDVGPSSAAALTQSGVGVATFVLLFAVLPVVLALLVAIACDRALVFLFERSPIALRLVVPTLAALATYRAFTALTGGHWELKQLAVLALGVLLVLAKRCAATWAAALRLPGTRWIVAGLVTAVGALVLGGSLPDDATQTAYCALKHPTEPVRFVHTHRTLPFLAHIGVLRVRADPVELAWVDGTSHVPLPRQPLVYLGDAGGRVFVSSVSQCDTAQLPEGSVVLTTKPNATHCHWWRYPPVTTSPCA
jgi:hypothetical protein